MIVLVAVGSTATWRTGGPRTENLDGRGALPPASTGIRHGDCMQIISVVKFKFFKLSVIINYYLLFNSKRILYAAW